ncbi:DUF982 domain-containing protein [Paracoccus aminophilus]|uniref:DUF982 domain-containing protein n=1 Tax=Paracoccus aminophilus JCM 7686 TaxID=1367847 RepID=S5XXF2_PARAH|nr:DUF982 domain-containing protein [Paracoccus aminophilus]AGT08105.1 hypothetical protein JCM7686_0996 [Paracoccus aminophilus JCM 7686]
MIELNWGKPLAFDTAQSGTSYTISTIEQAQYWLEEKWPTADLPRDAGVLRDKALCAVEDAMACLIPVEEARIAFSKAAQHAGFCNLRLASR